MQLSSLALVAVMLLCAELLLVLARSTQLQTLAKPDSQRTPSERSDVKRGMARSVLLEALVFVPASVLLVYITIRPILLLNGTLRDATQHADSVALAFYGSLGMTSYGFPFGAIKRLMTRIAMNTLKEFASIAHGTAESEGPEAHASTTV